MLQALQPAMTLKGKVEGSRQSNSAVKEGIAILKIHHKENNKYYSKILKSASKI